MGNIPEFYAADCNIYITIQHLEELLKNKKAELSVYRKKNKHVKVYKDNLSMSYLSNELNSYSFEVNAFNLVKNAENCKMIIGDEKELVLFSNGPDSESDTELEAKKQLKMHYDKYAEDHMTDSSSEFSFGVFHILGSFWAIGLIFTENLKVKLEVLAF